MPYESLPMAALKRLDWNVNLRQSQSFARSGASFAIEYGEPFISIDAQFENLSEAEMRALSAFIARRDGLAVPFRCHNPARRKPLLVTDENALTPVLTEVSAGLLRIDTGVNELLSEGDMVAYNTFAGARFIAEISSIVASTSTSVDFQTQIIAPTPAAIPDLQIVAAEGLFRLVPNSVVISEPYDLRRRVSFSARQLEIPHAEPT